MIDDPFGGRPVKEWFGKRPQSMPPPKVRDRILKRYGNRCYLSGVEITPGVPWDAEHKRALSLGGENRESNYAPAIRAPHMVKTKAEKKLKDKADRVRRSVHGIKKASSRPMPGSKASGWKRGFNGKVTRRER